MPADRTDTVSVRHSEDLALARKVAGGDKRATRILVDRLMNRVRATIGYLSGAGDDADDYAQLALVEVLRSIGSYRGETKLDYWADKIAVRTAMRHMKKRRVKMSQMTELTPESMGVDERTPQTLAARRQLRKRLAEHIAKLPTERRTVVTMRLVHEYSINEIADITGAPSNTVRDRLRIGRKELQKSILADPSLKRWAKSLS